MATLATSTFTRYNLNDLEKLAGGQLTITQKQLYQTELADIAEQILALEFDSSKPHEFVQRDAYLKGQLSVYRYLIELDIQVTKTIASPDFQHSPN